jgi:hypothetical protein
MEIKEGTAYLVSTFDWFTGPDGQSYKSAWGKVFVKKTLDILGFDPKEPVRGIANWFLKVGSGSGHILIAGCQVRYLVECKSKPKDRLANVTYRDKDTGVEYLASRIYIAGGNG